MAVKGFDFDQMDEEEGRRRDQGAAAANRVFEKAWEISTRTLGGSVDNSTGGASNDIEAAVADTMREGTSSRTRAGR